MQRGGKPGPVGRIEPDSLAVELALDDRDLVPQGENLGVLVTVAPREQL
jgi:hypothetical protein